VQRLGSAVAVRCARLDILMYNRVIALGNEEPARDEDLERSTRFFSEAGVPRFMVQVRPDAEPGEFRDALVAHGFVQHNYWLRLHRDAEAPLPPLPEPALPIRSLKTSEAGAFAAMVAEAFHHPPELPAWIAAVVGCEGWSHFAAFDGATLAAAGALFVRGDTAWIGQAATSESYRGRGLQRELIARRVTAARLLGAKHVAVETSADTSEKPNPSTHNLRRLGFRELYARDNWVKVLRDSPRP
jgi:GNAT superfamily N-acetyltransferase